jgi:hypothetical protein
MHFFGSKLKFSQIFPDTASPWALCCNNYCDMPLTFPAACNTLCINEVNPGRNIMTTVRLPYDLEEQLYAASRAQNKSKSQFVREALAHYMYEEETEPSAWEVGEPYFGNYGSGDGNLSVDYKNRLKDKIRARRSTH